MTYRMTVSEILLESLSDAKVGFVIATVLGYCLYKIMTVRDRRKLGASNDSNKSLDNIVRTTKILILAFIYK